jgi:hypothetical protein
MALILKFEITIYVIKIHHLDDPGSSLFLPTGNFYLHLKGQLSLTTLILSLILDTENSRDSLVGH